MLITFEESLCEGEQGDLELEENVDGAEEEVVVEHAFVQT